MGFKYDAYHFNRMPDGKCAVVRFKRDSNNSGTFTKSGQYVFIGDYDDAVEVVDNMICEVCDVIVDRYHDDKPAMVDDNES